MGQTKSKLLIYPQDGALPFGFPLTPLLTKGGSWEGLAVKLQP